MTDENVTPETPEKDTVEAPETPEPKPTPPPTPPAVDTPEPSGKESVETLPDWAQREIRTIRNEAKNLRTRLKDDVAAATETARKEVATAIGKALGLVEEETDPATLLEAAKAETTQRAAEAAAAKLELAVYRTADSLGADGNALLDSRSFLEKVAKLDPTATDYATQVEALVKETVESDKKWRKPQAAQASTTGTPLGAAPQPEKNEIDEMRNSYKDRRGMMP